MGSSKNAHGTHIFYEDYDDIKESRQQAIEEGQDTFVFKGQLMAVDYAKYVLEFFDMKRDEIERKRKH